VNKAAEILEFRGIPFRLARRRVRRARIEFVLPQPLLVVPLRMNPRSVLEANGDSIQRRWERACAKWREAARLTLLNRDEAETRRLAEAYLGRYSRILGVDCRELQWRHMRSRWGTCASTGTIRLNRFLRHLPEPLLAYVVFHETLHLVIMGHNRNFHRTVARVFPHYRELDKRLELYGIRMRHPDLGTVLVSL